jgi:hypothetical protein
MSISRAKGLKHNRKPWVKVCVCVCVCERERERENRSLDSSYPNQILTEQVTNTPLIGYANFSFFERLYNDVRAVTKMLRYTPPTGAVTSNLITNMHFHIS